MDMQKMKETVVLVDADFIDLMANGLKVGFGQKFSRTIPNADLAEFLLYSACDGGLRDGKNEVQVILIHSKEKKGFEHFTPSNFDNELDGKAFTDPDFGEFCISCIADENLMESETLMMQCVRAVLGAKEVERLIIAANPETDEFDIRDLIKSKPTDKNVTVVTPMPMGGVEIGESNMIHGLVHALGGD